MTTRLSQLSITIVLLVMCAMPSLAQAPTKARALTPKQAQQVMTTTPGIVILDIRTPEEYRSGHIKGAENMDFYSRDFQKDLNALDKTKPYLIYCRTGRRSNVTIKYMEQMGFENILHMAKGIMDWTGRGLPLEH